jgi:hypothetical protein
VFSHSTKDGTGVQVGAQIVLGSESPPSLEVADELRVAMERSDHRRLPGGGVSGVLKILDSCGAGVDMRR